MKAKIMEVSPVLTFHTTFFFVTVQIMQAAKQLQDFVALKDTSREPE